jgi:hypothetical protein
MEGSLNKPQAYLKYMTFVGGVAVAVVYVIVLFCQNVIFFSYLQVLTTCIEVNCVYFILNFRSVDWIVQ